MKGSLDELDGELLEQSRAKGESHSLALNSLAQGLWPELRPRMEHWPRACWALRAAEAGILIELNVRPVIAYRLGRQPRVQILYLISLCEQLEDGALRRRPWRSDSVAATIRLLDECLADLPAEPSPEQPFVGPLRPPDRQGSAAR